MPELLIHTAGDISVYLEAEGDPVVDRTVLLTLTSPRGAEVVSGAEATDLGDGWYLYSIAGALLNERGRYRATWVSAGDPSIEIATFHSCGWVKPGLPTLADLRRRIAREAGVLVHRGSITDVSDTSSLIDASLVIGDSNEYVGLWFIFTSGRNISVERRVVSFDAGTKTLTLAPPLDTAPDIGASYLLLNLGVMRPSDITALVNDAITDLGETAYIEAVDEGLVSVAGQYEYDVPDGFNTVHQVSLWDSTLGVYQALDPSVWTLEPGGIIRLDPPAVDSNLGMRVAGTMAADTLHFDAQYCQVRPEWVVQFAVTALHAARGGGQVSDIDDNRRAEAFDSQRAQQLERRRAVGRLPVNSRRVR
jgi:hypothetical protein